MASNKPSAFALLPTALLFGLGIGNLWGVAGLFVPSANSGWAWAPKLFCLVVLVACLSGVARVWWSRGPTVPILAIVLVGWLFSAPVAVAMGKFTAFAWQVWLVTLLGCGLVALLVAWIIERRRPAEPMPDTTRQRQASEPGR